MSQLSAISRKANYWIEIRNPGAQEVGGLGKMQREVWSQREQPTQVQSLCQKNCPCQRLPARGPSRKLQKAPEGKEEAIAQLLHKGLMPHDSLINSRGPALPSAISPPGLNSRGSETGRSWLTGRSCTNRDKRPTSNVWPSGGGLKLGTNLEFLCSQTWSF